MHPLLQKQQALHTEATQLLEQTLLPLLSKYGTMTVGGSYVYQLLNHPDIDIDVVNDQASKELFAQLCAELIALPYTSKFKSGDRVNFPHAHPGTRPTGYWISPEITIGSNVWKLDIWLQKSEWHTGDTNRYADELLHLNDEARLTVLSLKDELIGKNLYGVGKEFISVDVYEGVLRGHVRTIEELRSFIETTR